MDKHGIRIEIFNSTLMLLQQGWYISEGGNKILFPDVKDVMGAAQMYRKPFSVSKPVGNKTEIIVEDKDCVVAAMELIDKGYNPAMLNLADLYMPGGIVEYGSGAQEENLCRRSNLVQSLYQFSKIRINQYPELGLQVNKAQYPMDERYGGVHSGIVTFFRSTEEQGSMHLDKPYNIPVISVAALDKPRIEANGEMSRAETAITLEKIRTIFRIGIDKGHDSLVLSALGCGAFSNPPAHIAKLFHQVIEEPEFKDAFKLIDFAILDGYRTGLYHNPEGNLKPFQREFMNTSKSLARGYPQ